MELFRPGTGIDFIHVPYKGSANTVPDLIGGQADMTMSSAISLLPHIKAGRIRAFAITSAQRGGAGPAHHRGIRLSRARIRDVGVPARAE